MIGLMSLLLLFALHQSASKKDDPLVSDKDPLYLSCTVWTGKSWTAPTAHGKDSLTYVCCRASRLRGS